MLYLCFLDFSVGVGTFVIGLSEISSFFLQIVLLSKGYLLLCKKRVRAQTAILVIPYNNVVGREDTAFK